MVKDNIGVDIANDLRQTQIIMGRTQVLNWESGVKPEQLTSTEKATRRL